VYSDDDVAALYDRLNPWEASDDFYLSYVLEAASVLDVGCGTGRLLHRAREAGHGGRLCGIDPDPASLARPCGGPTGAGCGSSTPKRSRKPLGRAGFEVEVWYGGWSRGPLTEDSDNIVVVAKAATEPHGR
jgi:SAM-dependent methyltransferase